MILIAHHIGLRTDVALERRSSPHQFLQRQTSARSCALNLTAREGCVGELSVCLWESLQLSTSLSTCVVSSLTWADAGVSDRERAWDKKNAGWRMQRQMALSSFDSPETQALLCLVHVRGLQERFSS